MMGDSNRIAVYKEIMSYKNRSCTENLKNKISFDVYREKKEIVDNNYTLSYSIIRVKYLKPILSFIKDNCVMSIPFFIADFIDKYEEDFIVIDKLIVKNKYSGIGSIVLNDLSMKYQGTFPILLMAGIIEEEVYNELKCNTENFSSYLNGLKYFYEKNDFIDVNNVIGNYTEAIIMLNSNKCYTKGLADIIKESNNTNSMKNMNLFSNIPI